MKSVVLWSMVSFANNLSSGVGAAKNETETLVGNRILCLAIDHVGRAIPRFAERYGSMFAFPSFLQSAQHRREQAVGV